MMRLNLIKNFSMLSMLGVLEVQKQQLPKSFSQLKKYVYYNITNMS